MERMNQNQIVSTTNLPREKWPRVGEQQQRASGSAASSPLVAAASARSGPGECKSALVSLSPCVDYMCRDEATAALGRCCSQLRSVSRSRPQCLCAALGVDRTSALSLPVVCNVWTVSESECGGSVRAGSTHAGAAAF